MMNTNKYIIGIMMLILTSGFISICFAKHVSDAEYIKNRVEMLRNDDKQLELTEFCIWYAHQHFYDETTPPEWLNDKGQIVAFKVAIEVELKRREYDRLKKIYEKESK